MNLYLILLIPIGLSLQVCDHKSCLQCLRDRDICVWCSQIDFELINRCIQAKDVHENWCPNGRINPNNTVTRILDLDFNSTIGSVVQMKPQKLKVRIRPGSSVDFEFAFKRADNYPVDLYFLFDASLNMAYIVNETARQTEEVYEIMMKITNNTLLGIGSFIDKNALPFTNSNDSTHTYSFQNRLPLNKDLTLFRSILYNMTYGSNYDPPEAVLDALAQVILCKSEIGWRLESTKIVLVQTNGSYHVTGDSKYAGIFQPYDGVCYLKENKYDKELKMDYPSVNLINKLVSDDQIIVIFVIDSNSHNVYDTLRKNIRNSKMTVSNDDNQLSEIINNVYKSIVQNLEIYINIGSEYQKYFKISFNPNCFSNPSMRKCRIRDGQEKIINGTIELLEYIEAETISIDVLFKGIKEKIQIDIEIIKECNCEKEYNSTFCKGGGTLNCGVCDCYGDRYGEKCNSPNDFSSCMYGNSSVVCSNHGRCYQGKCYCQEGYTGEYCECKAACPPGSDDRCECVCGSCKCKPGWTGALCTCRSPPDCGHNNTCNGLGECVCGQCECQHTDNWDARTKKDIYCNVVCSEASCHESQCLILETLVRSHLKEKDHKLGDNLRMVDNLTRSLETKKNSSVIWHVCPNLRVNVGCYTKFMYAYNQETYGVNIEVQSEFYYAATYYFLGGISLVILILIGVATLVAWKFITDRRDRLEFDRFEKEVKESSVMWENPTFQAATVTIQNPTFGK